MRTIVGVMIIGMLLCIALGFLYGCGGNEVTAPPVNNGSADKSICGASIRCSGCDFPTTCTLPLFHLGPHWALCIECIMDPNDPGDDKRPDPLLEEQDPWGPPHKGHKYAAIARAQQREANYSGGWQFGQCSIDPFSWLRK